MTTRAVLFDVGGPLDTEVLHEQFIDRDLVRAFAANGVAVSAEALSAASDAAVASFAPDTYAAMAWTLARGDGALANAAIARLRDPEWSAARAAARGGLELRPGMGPLLQRLHAAGLLLGLAANQPARIIAALDQHGIGGLFSHREVSGHHGYRKPDVRLFLRACEDLEVEPRECIMAGDRIDNDIVPARLLGMRTVLFRTGRHIAQQPRSAEDVPDVEARDVDGLQAAIEALRWA